MIIDSNQKGGEGFEKDKSDMVMKIDNDTIDNWQIQIIDQKINLFVFLSQILCNMYATVPIQEQQGGKSLTCEVPTSLHMIS